MVLKKLSQSLKITLALMLSVFSTGLVQLYAAPSVGATNNGTLKVHEKGTASDTESNDPKVCVFNFEGFQFDAGQSGLIVIEPQGGDSDTTDTASLAFGPTDASGYAQTAYINDGGTTLDNGHYKSTLYGKDTNDEYTIDLKAKSKVFKVECAPTVTKIEIPGTPSTNDPCSTGNASWIVPTDTADLNWNLESNGHLTVTIIPANTTFTDGSTSHDYGVALETNINACPTNVTPAAPSKDDMCELKDDTFTIPSTTGVEYRVGANVVAAGEHSTDDALSVTVTAHPLTGYVLTGTTSWTLTFTGDECENEVIDLCPNTPELDLIIPTGLVKDNNGNCVTDQCPLVPGVQTNTTLCPPGQGGGQTLGTSTTTPQVLSTSTELPSTLPATGGSNNPFMIVLASILAYGVAYFLQGRRQVARNEI